MSIKSSRGTRQHSNLTRDACRHATQRHQTLPALRKLSDSGAELLAPDNAGHLRPAERMGGELDKTAFALTYEQHSPGVCRFPPGQLPGGRSTEGIGMRRYERQPVPRRARVIMRRQRRRIRDDCRRGGWSGGGQGFRLRRVHVGSRDGARPPPCGCVAQAGSHALLPPAPSRADKVQASNRGNASRSSNAARAISRIMIVSFRNAGSRRSSSRMDSKRTERCAGDGASPLAWASVTVMTAGAGAGHLESSAWVHSPSQRARLSASLSLRATDPSLEAEPNTTAWRPVCTGRPQGVKDSRRGTATPPRP